MKRAILAAILVMGLFTCSAQPTPTPAPVAPIDQAGPAPVERGIVEVRLAPARGGGSVRWREEMLGLGTAFFEAGLADLDEVIPLVEGNAPAPGLDGALRGGRTVWTGTVDVGPAREGLRFSLELCDPAATCTTFAAAAPRERPEPALAAVLRDAAGALGKQPGKELAAAWEAPLSRDPYAILLAGRSAAAFYGIVARPAEELVGDKRRDPITRAVLVDPMLALSQWVNGRRALARGQAFGARSAFTRASLSQPWRVLYRADEAAAVRASGHLEEARRAWDLVQARAPDQLRFAIARARSQVETRDFADAAALLGKLPDRFDGDVAVIELWVQVSEAGGKAPPYDGLLARWQFAAPEEPEPVRRRIALRVREGRYDEAVSFLRPLEERGATEEASRLAISLGVATGDYALAAAKADELGMPATAARIRARAALIEAPDVVPQELARAEAPVELVARGAAHLRGGRAAQALQDADGALRRDPWLPEALALRARALGQLGRRDDAERAARLLRSVDPAWRLEDPAAPLRPEVQARTD